MMVGPHRLPWLPALLALGALACSEGGASSAGPSNNGPPVSLDDVTEAAADEAYRRAREERLDREFPLHGLVTGTQLQIRSAPDPESTIVGWLRIGARIRMKREPTPTDRCSSGWYELAPRGFACSGQGIQVGEAPPMPDFPVAEANRESPLPYAYYYVKDPMVPQFHQLPSRDQQRASVAYGERYVELLEQDERKAARFLAGELPGEPTSPVVVARYLNRGFWLASTGVEVRSQRRFARTVGGGYVKEANLEPRTGSSFQGVEVSAEHPLPLAFVLRAAQPLVLEQRADGTTRWTPDATVAPLERHTVLESWRERRRIGADIMHVLEGDRYLKAWFLGVAEKLEPPFTVEPGEPWVHVDLSEQTLVVYRGTEPVYATIVSTGLPEHATPAGTFTIRRKFVSDTMADLGPDAGDDRYRIEDVPWTQYFEGSIALHGAMWHNRFGLPRSHGCVNLSPRDARRVWLETWPRVPEGWHGVSTDRTGFRGSRVHITE